MEAYSIDVAQVTSESMHSYHVPCFGLRLPGGPLSGQIYLGMIIRMQTASFRKDLLSQQDERNRFVSLLAVEVSCRHDELIHP